MLSYLTIAFFKTLTERLGFVLFIACAAGTRRLYNVSFRAYLRYVIYERLLNVVTTFVNESCFTYV